MAFVKTLAWFGVTILSAVLCFGQTFTVGSTTTQLTPAQRGSVASDWLDGNMGAIYQNGTNYVFAPSTDPGTVQITLPNLNTWSSGLSLDTPATNLQYGASGAFDQNYIGGGPVYYDSSSGYLIQMYHGENWNGCPGSCTASYAALGLAYSTDFGNNWHKLGEVISPQSTRVVSGATCQADVGIGTLLVVGSYFYAYYTDTPTGCGNLGFTVARASVASVIAAAEAGTPFTSGAGTLFMKYTGSGTWTGDGVTDLANPQNGGGAFSVLATDFNGYGIYVPQVRYNSYLSQYVLAYSNFDDIVLMTSPDGLTWGNPQNIVTGYSGGPPNAAFYPSMFNTSGGDPQTLGQNFSVFYVAPFGNWSNSSLYSVAVSAGSRPAPPVLNQPAVN